MTTPLTLWYVNGDPAFTLVPTKIEAETHARKLFPHEDPDKRYARIHYKEFGEGELIAVEGLREGDRVDLESCQFFRHHASAPYEYAYVNQVERETADCTVVHYMDLPSTGYPRGTRLVALRNPDAAEDDGDPKGPVMYEVPASDADAQTVLLAPQGDDGRSEFRWVTFANGDVALIVYPRGELFERLMQKGAFT